MIVIDLIYNLSLLVALSVLSGFIDQRFDRKTLKGQILQGLLFGIIAVTGMYYSFKIEEGLIFDGRSIVISLCSLFFGPISGIITVIFSTAYRIYIGGAGIYMGLLVIAESFLVGTLFYYLKNRSNHILTKWQLYLFGLLVHGIMVTLMLVLPTKQFFDVMRIVAVTVIIFYPVISLIIGKILLDQEERNSFMKRVSDSEERFKIALRTSQYAIVIAKIDDGKIIDVNEGFTTFSGYQRTEVVGKTPLELNLWVDENEYNTFVSDLINKTCIYEKEYKFRKKNGVPLVGKLSAEIINFIDNKYVFVSINNVTEHKQSELIQIIQYNIAKAIIVSNNLESLIRIIRNELSALFDTNNFFVAFYDKKSGILKKSVWFDENDNFTEWKAENSLSGIVAAESRTLLLDREGIIKLSEERNLNLVGTPAACWLGVPIKIKNETIGVIVVQSYSDRNAYNARKAEVLEIISSQLSIFIEKKNAESELIIAKEKAEESDRLKTSFLQNMSHEIRTPMNGILGFASLIADENISIDEIKSYAGIILNSGNRLLELLNNIIDISKIESGSISVTFSDFSVNKLILDAAEPFRNISENKNIELKISFPSDKDDIVLNSDFLKVYQIINNLLSNAIKFTNQGFVEIGYRIVGSVIEIFVKDTGVGIPENHRDKIFNRFYQADTSLNRGFEGAGLGLSISKGLAGLLGGDIRFESEKDKGSVFYFTLPLQKPLISEPVKEIKKIEESDKDTLILIAEDDETSFNYIKAVLKLAGYNKLIRARDGIEAVDICSKNKNIKLVLMDIKLPGMNGLDATHNIKKNRPNLPIIAQTANAFTHDREEALQAGCDAFISKPMRKEDLYEIIARCLKQ